MEEAESEVVLLGAAAFVFASMLRMLMTHAAV